MMPLINTKAISKSVSLSADLWNRAREQSWAEKRSLSKLVAEAVETYLKAKSERRSSTDD